MNNLMKFWPIILAIFAIGSVSGAQQMKIQSLETAIVQQSDIKERLIRQEEHSKSLKDNFNKLVESYEQDAIEQKEFRRELLELLKDK